MIVIKSNNYKFNIVKKLLLLLFIFTTTICFSQKRSKEERQRLLDGKKKGLITTYIPRDSLRYDVKYCLLLATGKLFSKKVNIQIDYGQDATFFEDTRIRDKDGNIIQFNSVMDALNYMNSLGWQFVDSYAITIGNQNVYHYLLKANEDSNFDFIPKTKRDLLNSN